ncbi:alcohol dehydrogenase [Acetobacter oeni LMG 21952]|nr:alcohol dehydrogenase [Acetobacter oeni LMG 21952]
MFPVPASLPLRFAALAEPLSVALHAISRLSPASGAPVVVCGGGTIGGLSALVLARREHPVHVVERHPGRQTLLREVFGSDGPAFVLDTTGSAQLVDTVVPLIGRGGTLVLAGLFRQSPCPDFNLIVEREIDLRGVSAFADEMHEAIALLPLLADDLEAFITPRISLADVPGTCERLLAGGEVKLKTLIAPNGMDYGW